MDVKKSMTMLCALERITRAIKVSVDDLEEHVDDPVFEDYISNLKGVEVELDSTIYAIEQMLQECERS